MKTWPLVGVILMQTLLLLAHSFIFRTWVAFWPLPPEQTLALRTGLIVLAFSFIVAALLGFYYSNFVVRLIYRLAAIWLGFLNFFFLAAVASWLCWFALRIFIDPARKYWQGAPSISALFGGNGWDSASLFSCRINCVVGSFPLARPWIAAAFYSLALLVSLYGLLNARWLRVRRVTVLLPNLPAAWRGRTSLLVSDLHLGNIHGAGFAQRIVDLAAQLHPDAVFLPGDLFDGSHADPALLIAPFQQLQPPLGIYYSCGNHEEYGGAAHYSTALTQVGIRVLENEKVVVEGLQILGISFGDSTYPIRLRAALDSLHLDKGTASILLSHAPNRLPIVEEAGLSLQLSGHTHGGQIFPFTTFTRFIFGNFTHGLQRFGALQVYTSTGAGSWGPPMRVGTSSEVVLLKFE